MGAEGRGSYSLTACLAGAPRFLRLKSIRRWARLAPPPRWRVVILPWLLRPACFCNFTTRDFSGFVFLISSKVDTDMPRRPGDVGLYFLIGIFSTPLFLQSVDRLPFTHGDNLFFPLPLPLL